jgi:hypothetical protein
MDFVIENGRIKYDNFILTIAKIYDLKFYGSVGFDDSVDLIVSLPVRAALLEKYGVKDSALEYARFLEGARVDVPVVGTRMKPKLDFNKVDLKPLLDKAAQGLLKEQAGQLLDKVLKKKEEPAKEPQTEPEKKEKPKSTEEQIFDIFKDVLEQQKKKDKEPEK